MITSKLAARQLYKNKSRTFITLLGIVLSVAMVTAITGFAESARDILRRSYISGRGNWHATFRGVTEEDVAKIENEPRVENVYTDYENDMLCVRFRVVKPDKKFMETFDSIHRDNEITIGTTLIVNRELLMAEGVIQDTLMLSIYSFCGVLAAIVAVGSVLVISNAFSISINERIRWFGLLKSVGATKEQIWRVVITEALILSAAAIPLGVLAGFLIEKVALMIANSLLSEAFNTVRSFDGTLRVIISPPAVLAAVAVSFVTVILSAWIPASRASRISAIDAIRLTREIKIKPKKVRTSRLVKALFGFEGALADKSLKRNKAKYRATVISLVTSMVLFVGGSSFGEYLGKSIETVYADYGINAVAVIIGQRSQLFDEAANNISNISGAETWLSYSQYYRSETLDGVLSRDALEYVSISMVRVHSMPDVDFSRLCRELSAEGDTLSGGIIINTMSAAVDDKKIIFKPVDFKKDMIVSFGYENEYSIGLIAETADIPKHIVMRFGEGMLNIVVAESSFDLYHKAEDEVMATISANTEDSAGFIEQARERIQLLNENETAAYSLSDINREVRLNRNLILLVNVFILGFVLLLSLIAATSAIGTISTNMTLRKQEIAMLQSVGMTQEDMRRMLNYESLLYGLKSLCYGIPLSLLASWLFYMALSSSLDFGYILPWKSLVICVAAVLSLTAGTIRYSAKKLGAGSIAELLRSGN